ncbi:hypothetical protein QT397_10175 [Microbulbifer sp. MKSA007]|uniref:hypothetical protein n=1 Tax=Microbulbifer sp. EKSA005 TaxID=3243364 RepID=UPI002B28038B|nr:hypothetical protein QT397_10175 [Microbulbifer sp. MKSA007]
MDFKQITISFGKEAIPFLIWGLLLMLAIENLSFLPFKKEIEDVFFESAAIKTICVLFSMVILASGLYLLIFGASEVVWWKELIVQHVVNAPAKFGITFSAVAFGLFNGLAIAAALSGYKSGAIHVFLMSLYLVFIALICWMATAVIANGQLKSLISGSERIVGIVMIVASPLLLWLVLKTA